MDNGDGEYDKCLYRGRIIIKITARMRLAMIGTVAVMTVMARVML